MPVELTDEEALGRWDEAVEAGLEIETCALCKGSAGVADLDISHALGGPGANSSRWEVDHAVVEGDENGVGDGLVQELVCRWQEHQEARSVGGAGRIFEECGSGPEEQKAEALALTAADKRAWFHVSIL